MLPKRNLHFIKTDPETAKTQLVIVTGLLVIAAVFQNDTPAYVALIIGVLCLAVKPIGDRIVWFWYKLAEGLGWFNSRLLLSLIYFLFITPIALLFRMFGNDPLALKGQKGSIYEIRDHTYSKKDLSNPW